MSADARLQPGSEFGGCRIESMVARGGMGVVYLATQMSLGRKVALKVLAPELADNPGFRVRFEHESRLAAAIDHPHIIPLYEAGEAEGLLYITMRYVDGTDLRNLLDKEKTLDPERALAIAGQVANALDAAHAGGLIHRDVKPANILIASGQGRERSDHCYLTDFGLTKQTGGQSIALTATGQFVGTISYVAPEQIDGEPDGSNDQYSLACVLFECLAGQAPYVRDSEVAVLFAHMQEEPPSLTALRPDLPAALDAVFARGMAKDPAERYPSCGELIGAARAAMIGAAPAAPPKAAPAPGADATRPSAPQPSLGDPTRASDTPGGLDLGREPTEAPPAKPGRLAATPPPPETITPAAFVQRDDTEAPAPRPREPKRERDQGESSGGGKLWGAAAVAALVVIVAGVAGFALGGGDSTETPTTPDATNVAAAGSLRLRFNNLWTTAAAPHAIPGVTLDDQLVLAPARASGASLTAGVAAPTPSLLPPKLRAALPGPPPAATIAKLPATEAYHFAGLKPEGVDGTVTLDIIPAAAGRVMLACIIPPGPQAEADASECAQIVASVVPSAGASASLQPDDGYASGLAKAIEQLQAARQAPNRELAAAGRSTGQVGAAQALAAADDAARRAVRGLTAPEAVLPANAAIASALGDRAAAYRQLATAAKGHRAGSYNNASTAIKRASARLAAAVATLSDYGYRVGGAT